MAYLHEDSEIFAAVITQAAQKLGIPEAIVEKDYYVTILLKELAARLPYIVFKGGTSLSKAHKVINRFSEDIDLASDKDLTQGEKKKLKYAIVEVADQLGLTIQNLEETRSRRQFNRYIMAYPSKGYPSALVPSVIVETPLMALAEPVQKLMIDSLAAEAIKDEAAELVSKYELQPFEMKVQSMARTFTDKVFAICDYYLENQTERHSRHLYDIAKLLPLVPQDAIFKRLVADVRTVRQSMSHCPSADPAVNVPDLLHEIIAKEAYRPDYEKVTRNLLGEPMTYDEAIKALEEVASGQIFD